MIQTDVKTLSIFDTCGYGKPSISARAVVFSPPEPQVSGMDFDFNSAGAIAQRITQKDLELPTDKDLLHFAEYEQSVTSIMWRINIQIIAMQVEDYICGNEEEKTLWKQKILYTLMDINKRAQIFNPSHLPADLRPPTDFWDARNATGNWCCDLIQELNFIFMNVLIVDISRTNN